MKEYKINIKRGDIFYADLSPVVGSEQGGNRPVLVLQNNIGNRYSPTVIVCALTGRTEKSEIPTHVNIGNACGLAKESFALLEQIRTIDRARLREKVGNLSDHDMKKINQALSISVGLSPAFFYEGRIFMSNKTMMFEKYPDVVEVNQLREMLGGISRKLTYKLLSEKEIHSVRIGRTYKIPKTCIIDYLMGEKICHIKIG